MTIVHVTHQVVLPDDHPAMPRIRELMVAATAARNQILYRQRQAFFDPEQRLPSVSKIRTQLKDEQHPVYTALPYKILRETSRTLQQSWTSFFALRKNGHASARIPKYRDHLAWSVLQFDANDQISKRALQRGWIKVGGIDEDLIPFSRGNDVRQVRIVPHHGRVLIEVVATRQEKPQVTGDLWAGVDLGVDNLAAVTIDDPGARPLVVKGSGVKSINQWAHKRTSWLKSQLQGRSRSSEQIRNVWRRRNARIDNDLHCASRATANYLRDAGVSDVVIGWNTGWKSDEGLSRKFNQSFRSIPHRKFVDMLTYKLQLAGIRVHVIEESYTSKTSLLDREDPCKQETYRGRRVRRGLFRSGTGRIINADVNAAGQIVRKCKPNAFHWLADGVEGLVAATPSVVWPGGGPACPDKSARRKPATNIAEPCVS